MTAFQLVQHFVWTSNPWHLLAIGYSAGCLAMLGGFFVLRLRKGIE